MGKHVANVDETFTRAAEMTHFWESFSRLSGIDPAIVKNYNSWKADRDYFADFTDGAFTATV